MEVKTDILVSAILLAIAIAMWRLMPLRIHFGLRSREWVVGGLLMSTALYGASFLQDSSALDLRLRQPSFLQRGSLELLYVGLIGPLAEEVCFRGVLISTLLPRWGWGRSLIISSLVFGVLHLDGVALGTLGGICFGAVYLNKGFFPAFCVHSAANMAMPLLDAHLLKLLSPAGNPSSLILGAFGWIGALGLVFAGRFFGLPPKSYEL